MVTGIVSKAKQPDEKVQGAQPPATDARAVDAARHTDTEPERTYNQREVDALLGRAGGRMKAQLELVTRERDDYRAKHESAAKTQETLSGEITSAKEQIETLNSTLESLNSEDTAKVVKTIRAWEQRIASLKEREDKLAPREQRVFDYERTEMIYTVADEYGLDEPEVKDRFKAAADRLKINDRDGMVSLAETMNLKLRDEEAEPPEEPEKKGKAPKVYSGKSEGGTTYFTRAQIADRKFWEEHKDEIKKAQREGRIRD